MMKILFLHQNPYRKVKYHQAVDHDANEIIYCGLKSFIEQVPDGLKCEKWIVSEWDKADLIRRIAAIGGVDRIITRQERLLLFAAELRAHFNLPGLPVEETKAYRDKREMKNRLISKGVRVPKSFSLNHLRGLSEAQYPWQGKTILKPVDGGSSVGISRFETFSQAIEYVEKKENSVDEEGYLLEEYIEGDIYHLDGFFYQGRIVTMLAHRYMGSCLEFAQGSPVASYQVHNSYLNFAERCLKALGGECVTFHLEFILTRSGPAFLECAARAGGAEIIQMYHLKTGINLNVLDIASQIKGELAKEHLSAKENQSCFGQVLAPMSFHLLSKKSVPVFEVLSESTHVVKFYQKNSDSQSASKVTYQFEALPMAAILSADTEIGLKLEINRFLTALSKLQNSQ
ncbi:MAG: hypothetical protein COV52_04385 [Gammaproteobacteria bacterium CG11_big_fil_rev_8_21_14_0_20_46_22]|nr:MAG: hypothetical protein COV52_04385 [Gammaproteobacteria bacterium CG11_big_fil_rev_8_21_14_0_20_46_22]